MPEKLIVKVQKLLAESPDGISINQLALKLNVNRFMLSGYLKAYEEVGLLRVFTIGPAYVYKLNENRT